MRKYLVLAIIGTVMALAWPVGSTPASAGDPLLGKGLK
jgi:hypothetical protein